MSNQQTQATLFEKIRPFLFAGTATMCSTSCVQPLDCLKVRIQTIGEQAGMKGEIPNKNPFRVAKMLFKTEGIRAFYRGLDAGLLRQATFGTTRLGVFRYLLEQEKVKKINNIRAQQIAEYNSTNNKAASSFVDESLLPEIADSQLDVNFWKRTGFALFSGFCASIVGTPIDIALVRFQSDYTLPEHQRRNYRHVFHAISSIAKEEGVKTLWRGYVGFTWRVIAITVTQLMVFDEMKKFATKMRGLEEADLTSRLIAVAFSGFFVSVAGLPFDNLKMKMQKMVPEIVESMSTEVDPATGKKKVIKISQLPYKSFTDCLTKTVKREGFFGLWIGFPAFYMLAAPHTMISLLIQDYLNYYFVDSKK